MKKVFLYLYPIEEYTKMFLFHNDKFYDEWKIKRPLPILNDTINKRYREKGYQVVYALYPDRKIFGIEKQDGDKIIYTDITFSETSVIDEMGNKKQNFTPKYPNELYLLKQLGDIEELVVGGYHSMDCVKKVAEQALNNNINTLVDLDLTDLFFNLYRREEYFNRESYDPKRLKEHMITSRENEMTDVMENIINENYKSPVYGFVDDTPVKMSSDIKTVKQINEEISKLRQNNQSVKEISDGYHTFEDYTDMRNRYFMALCEAYYDLSWKSKKHFDEENDPMFDGDFIAGINTPTGVITQHIKMEYWDELNVREISNAPEYDGYTEEDVKTRIKSLKRKKYPQ